MKLSQFEVSVKHEVAVLIVEAAPALRQTVSEVAVEFDCSAQVEELPCPGLLASQPVSWVRSEVRLVQGVDGPAILCHKEPARRIPTLNVK